MKIEKQSILARSFFPIGFFLMACLFSVASFSSAAWGESVTLAWDANSEANLAGYKLYYKGDTSGAPYNGTGLNEGDSPVVIHLTQLADPGSPNFTLTGLDSGRQYYFALTAFDTDGAESDYSDEVAFESPGASSYVILASADGGGVISPEGSVSVSAGGSRTFTIAADANHHIAGVTVDGGSVGQVGTYTFANVSASHRISALFEIDTFTVTAKAGENGSISPQGVTSAAYGTSLGYTITPADGYHIAKVLVDGTSVGQVATYTFSKVGTWHTIEAVFEADAGVIVVKDPVDAPVTPTEAPTDGSAAATGEETSALGTSSTQIDGNRAPNTPAPLSDLMEAPGVGPITLAVGAFSDPDSGDYHAKTEWQVFRSDDDVCVFSIASTSSLTEFRVPGIMLEEYAAYYWNARFFDGSNAASEWSEPAFFTTGGSDTDQDGNGIPDNQEVDESVDLNRDGIMDSRQAIIKSIALPLSNQAIGLSSDGSDTVMDILAMESVDVADLAVPDKIKLPYGLINFKLLMEQPGQTAIVTVYFSEPVHPRARWMKLDVVNGVWIDYSGYTQLSDDRMSMEIELEDGGFGDDDGVANGIIIDPAGVELAGADLASTTPETGIGFYGCFISGAVEDDAMCVSKAAVGILLLLAVAAVLYGGRRSGDPEKAH